MLPVFCGLQYVFVYWYFGFIGSPLAVAAGDYIQMVLMILYVIYFQGYEAWGGFSWKAFSNLGEFLKLSAFSMVSL